MNLKCPNCSFENARDAKYCQNCGQPLDRACPNCRTPNIADAKFCKNCGFNLANTPAPVASNALSALRQAAPNSLQQKIQLAKSRIIGERKLITVLFTDIVGSTALAEKLDPEEWGEIISGAHKRVSEVVYRYEGTIAQLLGDGVLAFFGAPIAHEDDPRRAINAALDIQDSIAEYRRSLKKEKRVESFEMRVGLNTGLVSVGNIGSDLHMEYLAIGDTVNLAARMQSAAEPNTILISDNTHRLVETLFDFEDRGTIEVKGKTESIHVYRVVRERKDAVPTRGIAGLSSPMVGRTREFSTLMQSTANLRAGQGSVVSIIGEAGLGKSRLVSEWRDAASKESSNSRMHWIMGRCLSYGSSIAFHLGVSVLRAAIGTNADSPESETRAALWQATEKLFGSEMKDVYPYLGYLLGVQLEPEMSMQVKQVEGAALKAMYSAATKRFLLAMAQAVPTIIVCEDIHWADVSSVELGLQVLPIIAEAPLMTVLVTRPDTEAPGWKMVTQADDVPGVGAIRLYLAPLAESDSQKLVSNLLGIESLPESIRQPILTKAEGNPFFVEEVIRMLIDRHGLIRRNSHWETTRDLQKIEIPDTLLGVLAARIDRLPEAAKRTLQIASVIGRAFQVELLDQVLDQEERAALASSLESLKSVGLIRQVMDSAKEKFFFRHALVQDAAYESLLKEDRRKLNLAIGQAMERLYANQLDEFAVLLSQHYVLAGDAAKTFEYAMRAGDAATKLYAHAEARQQYITALDALSQLPNTEDNSRRRIDTTVKYVSVSIVSDDPALNLSRLKEVEPLAQTLASSDPNSKTDRLRLARIHYWMGRAHFYRNESREAIGFYSQVLAEAEGSGDEELVVLPSSTLGQVSLLIRGQFGKASHLLNQAIPSFEKAGDWVEWIRATGYLGLALAGQGHYVEGIDAARRALARAKELNNLTAVGLVYLLTAGIYFTGRESGRVLDAVGNCLEVNKKTGDRLQAYIAYGHRAWAQSRLGLHQEAADSMKESQSINQMLGGRLVVADWFAAANAELAFNAGRMDDALKLAEDAVAYAKTVGSVFSEGMAHRIWGQALAALDPSQRTKIEEHLATSVQLLESGQTSIEAAHTHLAWGKYYLQQHVPANARDHFTKAAAQYQSSGLTDLEAQTSDLLDQIE